MNTKQIGGLLRINQWYKNSIIFLAIFFSGNLASVQALQQTILAFFALSFLSSAGYIINDLKDHKEDQLHPERKLRPLASGMIKPASALLFVLFLLLAGSYLALSINLLFVITAASFFILGQLYTFILKKVIFADIIAISLLFVLRAVAGAVAISVIISPWLILVPFFLALFLAAGKRYSDLHLLREKAGMTKKVLQEYTPEITNTLMIISTTLLIISYALYSFLSEHPLLIATLPLALYSIFRFYNLITSGSSIARNPEKSIKDVPLLIGIIIWVLTAAAVVYLL
ncbi:UbiA family prenyltransferase [Candidatus Woesearchaeota archaeon]|nr:UbiA family prenyltransferase [Candidatus Woesearchaeota archaeon]